MKIFEKVRCEDGRRKVYLFGFCIFSYKMKSSFEKELEAARRLGIKLGKGTQFIIHPHPWSRPDFGSEPYFIEVGEDCVLSFGITFLTHDGCIQTLKHFMRDTTNLSKFGKISIGNRCFIGCNSTIMPGVRIGNNCIVGACSVVTKNIPDNEVWAGNPARFITTTQELAARVEQQMNSPEDLELLRCYRELKSVYKK